jgi:hypothetical protein
MELETMSKTAQEQKQELSHRARSHALPDHNTDLDARAAPVACRPATGDESEPPRGRGLMVTLWLLAVLIAEVELWMWVFAHMYRL